MAEPRPMTVEEMEKRFLDAVIMAMLHWGRNRPPNDCLSEEDQKDPDKAVMYACEGLVHSILCILDGCAGEIPAFTLIPDPHPDDEEFMRNEGEDWWDPKPINKDCYLHDAFHARQRRRKTP